MGFGRPDAHSRQPRCVRRRSSHVAPGGARATERAARRATLVERLKSVKWAREQHWEGIAGKFTPKGTLSIGGSKETAYAVYAALNDPQSPAYLKVRGV